MKPELSSAVVDVRLTRTAQLRRLCLSVGANARAGGWRFAVGDEVHIAGDAHVSVGPGTRGRIVGRRLGATESGFGRAYLLELDDGRAVDVGERWLRG